MVHVILKYPVQHPQVPGDSGETPPGEQCQCLHPHRSAGLSGPLPGLSGLLPARAAVLVRAGALRVHQGLTEGGGAGGVCDLRQHGRWSVPVLSPTRYSGKYEIPVKIGVDFSPFTSKF